MVLETVNATCRLCMTNIVKKAAQSPLQLKIDAVVRPSHLGYEHYGRRVA